MKHVVCLLLCFL
uniref:Uncharacterized protein n=1 Tax=Arundo donax TaxID=35708 RepID=A0A0A8ZME8_ARUDO